MALDSVRLRLVLWIVAALMVVVVLLVIVGVIGGHGFGSSDQVPPPIPKTTP